MNKSALKSALLLGSICMLPLTVQAGTLSLSVDGNNATQPYHHLIAADSEGVKAQEFIDKMGQQAISFLSNQSLTPEQKAQEFRKLLKTSFDMRTIGRFAMGRFWKTATPAQQSEYQRLFENMIVKVYSGRFNDYKGEKFDVSSHRPDGKNDYLVNSFIVPASGSKIKVDWRVRSSQGQYRIIDVIIEGVSMSLTQRSDFSSVIQRGGGNVDVLIEHLRK